MKKRQKLAGMRRKLNLENKPRQLYKPVWMRTDSKIGGEWRTHWEDWRISCMDAPDSIPAGSSIWRIGYVEKGIEYGEATEKLYHREGFY